ncbi:MAG TPA: NAD(P)/FAD-dependent oxidoreductase, partial [Chloroflexia bacterium]|nr:NAD(P)/FAD-dependent oxidoreductase [Chloroflexia bacterium]
KDRTVKAQKRIAVVGAGHNALVCACYLAKAGHEVTVYERRSRVGGAVNTEELWPGYRVDTCSVMHILIHKTPIMEELGLHRFGLEYMQMDPWGFAPFPDGSHIMFYRDLDSTCRSIAVISERDAEAYRAFITKWHGFNQQVFELFSRSPAPGAAIGGIARRTAWEQIRGRGQADPSMSGLPLLRTVLGNYGRMLEETFTSAHVRAAVAWMAAQSGPPPSEIGAGALAGAHSLYHDVGATHPRGGSGMLSEALARCLEHYGGTVRCDVAVEKIVLSGGRVLGLQLAGGEQVKADLVVSGAHIQTTMLDLLGGENLPASTRRQVESLRVGNGIGMTVRCAVDELPNYTALHHGPKAGPGPEHHGMQLICPSVEYLQEAYGDAQAGSPARKPALVAMTPSSVDATIVPEGKHSLYIWAQYHPYSLAGGQSWDQIREREADRLIETLAEYAPNMAGAVTQRYIQSPLDLERNTGLLRGNIMHIDMSLDQMFMFRPLPEMSQYRTVLAGLYITGASTHPGGGVSGASGRNAASAVLSDMGGKRSRWRGWALAGGGLGGVAALGLRRRKKT